MKRLFYLWPFVSTSSDEVDFRSAHVQRVFNCTINFHYCIPVNPLYDLYQIFCHCYIQLPPGDYDGEYGVVAKFQTVTIFYCLLPRSIDKHAIVLCSTNMYTFCHLNFPPLPWLHTQSSKSFNNDSSVSLSNYYLIAHACLWKYVNFKLFASFTCLKFFFDFVR